VDAARARGDRGRGTAARWRRGGDGGTERLGSLARERRTSQPLRRRPRSRRDTGRDLRGRRVAADVAPTIFTAAARGRPPAPLDRSGAAARTESHGPHSGGVAAAPGEAAHGRRRGATPERN